jgi:hypothetical protein
MGSRGEGVPDTKTDASDWPSVTKSTRLGKCICEWIILVHPVYVWRPLQLVDNQLLNFASLQFVMMFYIKDHVFKSLRQFKIICC